MHLSHISRPNRMHFSDVHTRGTRDTKVTPDGAFWIIDDFENTYTKIYENR